MNYVKSFDQEIEMPIENKAKLYHSEKSLYANLLDNIDYIVDNFIDRLESHNKTYHCKI